MSAIQKIELNLLRFSGNTSISNWAYDDRLDGGKEIEKLYGLQRRDNQDVYGR